VSSKLRIATSCSTTTYDVGTIHPFCVRIVGLGRNRGNGPALPLARVEREHEPCLTVGAYGQKLDVPRQFCFSHPIHIRLDFRKRETRWTTTLTALCENVRTHGVRCLQTITPNVRHRSMEITGAYPRREIGSCACPCMRMYASRLARGDTSAR